MPSATKTTPIDVFARRESKIRSYCRSFPVVFERASGAELIDAQGRGYIDFLAGCSTLKPPPASPRLAPALSPRRVQRLMTPASDPPPASAEPEPRLISTRSSASGLTSSRARELLRGSLSGAPSR